MYCSECGTKVAGRFCSGCGTQVQAIEERHSFGEQQLIDLEPRGNWSLTTDYEELLRHAEVRELIARAASESKSSMTGEQFLEVCEKALAPFGATLPFAAIAKIAQPMSAKLGIKTGKERSQFFALPPGRVLVSVLCSLARHGRKLRQATQISDGCRLEAELPSDVFALAGNLTVTIRCQGSGALVEASTHIPGQLMDWGKSNRCLDQLLAEAAAAA
jgi:hypothetical protein